ncbi:hypothetical protein PM082_007076 [Marasmius tenuissimus]|nr:hypothetical protein PM082_007076 [Marasmius tenuissimus]
MGSIIVVNNSDKDISVFVSKYTGDGDDSWFTLPAFKRDSWSRKKGWELVAFAERDESNDPERAGRYVRVNHMVTFFDFDRIEVN